MTDLTLTCRRVIAAPAEKIYNAWLDPAVMAEFMAGGSDQRVTEATSDARVGGAFRVVMVSDKEIPHSGHYTALTPHSHIAFTWHSPYSPADSEVDLRFTPIDGGTEVVLRQVRFLSEGARDGHMKGWTLILERLDAVLSKATA